jgi:hypothetical protein
MPARAAHGADEPPISAAGQQADRLFADRPFNSIEEIAGLRDGVSCQHYTLGYRPFSHLRNALVIVEPRTCICKVRTQI